MYITGTPAPPTREVRQRRTQTTKDEINVPIALSAFWDKNTDQILIIVYIHAYWIDKLRPTQCKYHKYASPTDKRGTSPSNTDPILLYIHAYFSDKLRPTH